MRFIRFSRLAGMIVACVLLAASAVAQQKTSALTGVSWVQVTGSGAPTISSCGVTCSSVFYGLPYTDRTNQNYYIYTGTGPVAGWTQMNGAGAGTPGGTTGAAQYNNGGVFGGLNGTGFFYLNGAGAPTVATSAQTTTTINSVACLMGGTCTIASGGTVTSFTVAGWPSWLTPTVASPTTTPSLGVVASAIPNTALAPQTANTLLGALITGTTPSGMLVPTCDGPTNGLIWTPGVGFGCNSLAGTGTVTSVAVGAWPGWLTPTVTNATTTPSVAVVASAIPNSALASPTATVNGASCTLGSPCTVAAAAGTLTGTALAAAVVSSSLTSAAGGSFGTGAYAPAAVASPLTPGYLPVAATASTLGDSHLDYGVTNANAFTSTNEFVMPGLYIGYPFTTPSSNEVLFSTLYGPDNSEAAIGISDAFVFSFGQNIDPNGTILDPLQNAASFTMSTVGPYSYADVNVASAINTVPTSVMHFTPTGTTSYQPLHMPTGSDDNGTLFCLADGTNCPSAYVLPTATSTVLGGVKPDGTSILNTAGVLSVTPGSVGADVSGAAATAQSNAEAYASNASNLTSGTVAAARVATLNQNTTGTAANVTATSNSTLTTLPVLSLPYSQVSGTPSLSGYALLSGATFTGFVTLTSPVSTWQGAVANSINGAGFEWEPTVNGSADRYWGAVTDWLVAGDWSLHVSNASGGDPEGEGKSVIYATPTGVVSISQPGMTIANASGVKVAPCLADGTGGCLTSLSGALLATGATTGATSQAQEFTDGVLSDTTVATPHLVGYGPGVTLSGTGGTPTCAVGSCLDMRGRLSIPSGTTATVVTFSAGYTVAPVCTVTQNGGATFSPLPAWSSTTAALTITAGITLTTGEEFDYTCIQ